MSTYAVWGMTRPAAILMAKKIADKKAGNKTEQEWLKFVDEEADKIMKSGKMVILSDKFDAPSFAEDFKRLAQKIESRDLHVKAYCKSDQKSKKTGKPKMHWVAT